MRVDGTFEIYELQHQQSDGTWHDSNLDHFGHPPGFAGSGECWQTTGVTGTFDRREAKQGLTWIRKRNKDRKFRLVLRTVSRYTHAVQERKRTAQR